MTDVYIVALSIIGFLISAPGLAVALNLLMPNVTDRAYLRLEQTPFAAFILGAIVSGALTLWTVILLQFQFGPVQALAFVSGVLGLGIYGVGAAAMSRLLGERISHYTGSTSAIGDLVRGAVVLELACLVPFVGWFLFVPLAGMAILGAAVFGLVGWAPKLKGDAEVDESDDLSLTASPQMTNVEVS